MTIISTKHSSTTNGPPLKNMQFNCNGIRGKVNEFFRYMDNNNRHITAVGESIQQSPSGQLKQHYNGKLQCQPPIIAF